MSRVYGNPPLIEALCEFRFEPSQPWDWTVPGLIYAEIKGEFPKKREQTMVKVEVSPELGEVQYRSRGGVERVQLLRADESALVQIGVDFLVVNQLKPYPGWAVFKDMVARLLEVYFKVVAPKAVRRSGLRYINRIEIPELVEQFEDYLLIVPKVPESLPQTLAAWGQRVEVPIEAAQGVLVLQSGSLREDRQAGTVLILDLDLVRSPGEPAPLGKVMDWLEGAHREIEVIFEACMTDKARKLFGEVRHVG